MKEKDLFDQLLLTCLQKAERKRFLTTNFSYFTEICTGFLVFLITAPSLQLRAQEQYCVLEDVILTPQASSSWLSDSSKWY